MFIMCLTKLQCWLVGVRSSPYSSYGFEALFVCYSSFLEVSLSYRKGLGYWPLKGGS